jgi:uncharacterized protein (TIGR02588 family)
VPELISLAISSTIVLALVGALLYLQLTQSDRPALITAQAMQDEVQQEGDVYYVPVEIANHGGKAGEDVVVRLAIAYPDGQSQVGQLAIGFLAAGETAQGMLAVARDPRDAEIRIEAIGYLEPG